MGKIWNRSFHLISRYFASSNGNDAKWQTSHRICSLGLEPTDSRLVNAVQRVVPYIFSYRLTVGPTQTFTLRYVPILTGRTLNYALLFLGGYLLFAYLTRVLVPRSKLGSMVTGKVAWANLVLFPCAVLYLMVFVEEASYNSFLWNNFSWIFALGAIGILAVWFEIFLYDQPVMRRLVKIVPDRLKRLSKLPTPPYIQIWFMRRR